MCFPFRMGLDRLCHQFNLFRNLAPRSRLLTCDGLSKGLLHKAVQGNLPGRRANDRLFVQLRGYADVEAALVRPLRLSAFRRAKGKVVVHRAVKVLHQFFALVPS